MEAATRIDFHRMRRRQDFERRLEDLRPQGEAYLLRRYGHSLSRADAEDAVADVVIRLHRKIEAGDPPRNLRAAFFTSARNAAIDQLRSRSSKPTAPLELVAEAPAEQPTPIEVAERGEAAVRLREALERMRPNYREAILLRFGASLTVPEIADRLGISLPAAKKLVLRSTAQVRQRLLAIEGQEFCAEMRDAAHRSLIDREAAGLATESERRVLDAHFRHCGSCRTFLGELHGNLHEIGGTALLAGAADRSGITTQIGHWLGHASDATHSLAARVRLGALKASGAFNPADATSAGALTGTAQKIAAVCGAATATTATCLAAGVVGPGIGVAENPPPPPAQVRPAPTAGAESPTPEAVSPPAAEVTEPAPEPSPEPAADTKGPGAQPEPEPAPQPTPAEAATEQFSFEAESSSAPEPAPEPAPSPATPSPQPSAPQGNGGGGGGESFGFGG